MHSRSTCLLFTSLALSTAQQIPLGGEEQSPLTPKFDQLVSQTLAKWRVPGLAVAVVNGDEIYSKVCSAVTPMGI